MSAVVSNAVVEVFNENSTEVNRNDVIRQSPQAGEVLAINTVGTYDIPKDDLSFSGNISLKENKNWFARLATTPIRWPFAKIFGFRLKGVLGNPSWSYEQNIISLPSVLK